MSSTKNTVCITLRIEYEKTRDMADPDGAAIAKVVADARSHMHTIEDGIHLTYSPG